MKKEILLLVFFLSVISIVTAQVNLYSWPETAKVSDKYSVTVYQACNTHNLFTHMSEPNLLQGPDGDGVTGIHEDRTLSFVQFEFEGEIEIEVTKLYGTEADKVEITPKAFGIDPVYFDGRTVRFRFDHSYVPSYVSVHFISADNIDGGNNSSQSVKNGMMIFAEKPELSKPSLNDDGVVNYTTATQVEILAADVIYFPPGDHYLPDKFPSTGGRIFLTKNEQKVYVEGGAVVRGSIDADRKDNIWIYGRGIITGQDFYWHFYQEDGKKTAYIDLRGSDNTKVEGIIIENPTHHTIPSGKNSRFKNMKIIGWASNHDGVRSGGGSFMEEIFIKTSDDLDYARDPHSIVNSIMWPMRNGAFGQLGWNNLGTGFTNYQNIYFIHSEWDVNVDVKRNQGVIGSVLEQGVNLTNNIITNIYAEDGTALIANLTIKHENSGDPAPVNGSWGEIKNFQFRNILLEKSFLNSGNVPIKNKLSGFERDGAKATIHDINFVNIIAGNTIITNENADQFFDIDSNTTYNINFSTEGILLNVETSHNEGGKLVPDGTVPTPAGMDRFIQIIPNDGYKIMDVIIDGESKGRMQNVLFSQINNDHTLEVKFEIGDDHYGEPYDCLATSTRDIDLPELEVYPNPAFDQLTISNLSFNEVVEAFDVSGKKISDRVYKDSLNIADLQKGLYLLKVKGFSPIRIIKQ
ncbi:MAG: T9SS type A sorting domain-containing protein [Bacteroidota bacterium]